jgi:hypothetical protein
VSRPSHIMIDGRAYSWRELVERRKAQLAEAARPEQPALFEMHDDHRPPDERTAAGRFLQPGLF